MIRRVFVIAVLLGVVGGSGVALAKPASAIGVTITFGGGVPFPCHATGTVVPDGEIYFDGRYGWSESGEVTGSAKCQSSTATWEFALTGRWHRVGFGRDGVTGQCPRAEFFLQYGGQSHHWQEFTQESSLVQAPQIFGIDPFSTPPVPFGTDSISVPVATSYGLIQTDPAVCGAWPTQDSPPPLSLPPQPAFHFTGDFGVPVGAPAIPGGLLCLTVQGVLPRTCV